MDKIAGVIAHELGVKEFQVQNTIKLIDDGNSDLSLNFSYICLHTLYESSSNGGRLPETSLVIPPTSLGTTPSFINLLGQFDGKFEILGSGCSNVLAATNATFISGLSK